MKRIVDDSSSEGLEVLIGERVTIYCANYSYTGKLVGVDAIFVKLEDVAIVYDTGAHDNTNWADASAMPKPWYVMVGAIESFGIFKP